MRVGSVGRMARPGRARGFAENPATRERRARWPGPAGAVYRYYSGVCARGYPESVRAWAHVWGARTSSGGAGRINERLSSLSFHITRVSNYAFRERAGSRLRLRSGRHLPTPERAPRKRSASMAEIAGCEQFAVAGPSPRLIPRPGLPFLGAPSRRTL